MASVRQVDDLGRQRVTADKRPLVTPQSKWVYHYRQSADCCLKSKGTARRNLLNLSLQQFQ